MPELDFEKVRKFYSVDTYRIPQNIKEEIYLDFGNYGKYISRGFTDREEAANDKEVTACRCFKCNKTMKRIIKMVFYQQQVLLWSFFMSGTWSNKRSIQN